MTYRQILSTNLARNIKFGELILREQQTNLDVILDTSRVMLDDKRLLYERLLIILVTRMVLVQFVQQRIFRSSRKTKQKRQKFCLTIDHVIMDQRGNVPLIGNKFIENDGIALQYKCIGAKQTYLCNPSQVKALHFAHKT